MPRLPAPDETEGHMMMRKRADGIPAGEKLRLARAALAVLAVAACGGGAEEVELTTSRTYVPVGRDLHWGASDAERFGIAARDFAMDPRDASASSPLHYNLPAGWSELPAKQFREINLRVAGDERAECYLTTLSGEGGGLEANLNRWRRQLSLGALSAAEIEALPRVAWLGKRAVLADFEGTWTGMSGGASDANWRLVGLVLVEPAQSRFLKMVGPRDVIAAEVEPFMAFAASFRVDDGLPSGHPPLEPGRPVASSAPDASAPVQSGVSGQYSWTVPQAWRRAADRQMRDATYVCGAGGEVECYVTVLAGDGGGLEANINRWRQQLGAAAITAGELAALAREPMLGGDGAIVEVARGANASVPAQQELLLGALAIREERSVFVKMLGPRDAVELERAAFLEFCRSIRTKP
jgi:hypothetical protein